MISFEEAMTTEREWIIDADMSRDGLLAFCPVERNEAGELTCVVTGLTFISDKPPHNEKCIGVWSEAGEEAAADFAKANADRLSGLLATFFQSQPNPQPHPAQEGQIDGPHLQIHRSVR